MQENKLLLAFLTETEAMALLLPFVGPSLQKNECIFTNSVN